MLGLSPLFALALPLHVSQTAVFESASRSLSILLFFFFLGPLYLYSSPFILARSVPTSGVGTFLPSLFRPSFPQHLWNAETVGRFRFLLRMNRIVSALLAAGRRRSMDR